MTEFERPGHNRRTAVVVAIMGLVLGYASLAQAQDAMFYIPVPPDLIAFVSVHTGVRLADNLKLAVIDNASAILRHPSAEVQGISYVASGVEVAGQIYLPVGSAVHLQEDKYRAVLVHELTHVAQETGRRRFACDSQREAQAYDMQNLYLLLNDLPPALAADKIAALQNCSQAL